MTWGRGVAQHRLPGTLPAPEEARRQHKNAVAKVRIAEGHIEDLKDALKEARAALRSAERERRTAEDDLDAIEEGRRQEKTTSASNGTEAR